MSPADRYAHWRPVSLIAERLPTEVEPSFSEIDLQARWFAGRFPRHLRTTTGAEVEIIHLGVWNREPGPDFSDAVVRFAGGPPVQGSIEIDTHRRDWETHGHSTNPAFENVVLHLFFEPGRDEFFTRSPSHRLIPQVRLVPDDGDFLPAYPPLAVIGRCAAPLSDLDEALRENLIEAAAHFRLEKKSRAFARLAQCYEWDEAVYQSLAVALGYKENKLPFQLLAQRVSLETLRDEPQESEPLLFGLAGFLDATSLHDFTPETQDYLRSLWDRWWRIREKWQRLILPRSTWQRAGGRPANHPQRRLAAMALISRNWSAVAAAFRSASAATLGQTLGGLEHPYWSEHYTLSSARAVRPIALLGGTRITEILVNVAAPIAMLADPEHWRSLAAIQQPLENRKLKTGITRLFGGDGGRAAKNVLQQQGILQIYEDFCLRDLTDCERCPFPGKVRQWRSVA